MENCLRSMDFLGQSPFIQLPKSINTMKMSSDAKLLYANLADLMKLSEINGYRDEQGLYVFCSLEYIQEVLCCQKDKARKTVKELESNQLLLKRRMGQGKSNRYYLMLPKMEEIQKTEKPPSETIYMAEKPHSGELMSEKTTYNLVDRSFLESVFSAL